MSISHPPYPSQKSQSSMIESTVTAKGQTTLPKDIRDVLNLKPGDKLRYLIIGDEVRILRPRKVISLAGALAHKGTPKSVEEMREAIKRRAAER